VSELATTNGAVRLLTADELAKRWQVPKAQVYRLSREGVVPTVRIGRYFRYSLAAVEAFEAAGGVAADA
jgi:excisionase family DNA binding protein